jgi:hypothetical protein
LGGCLIVLRRAKMETASSTVRSHAVSETEWQDNRSRIMNADQLRGRRSIATQMPMASGLTTPCSATTIRSRPIALQWSISCSVVSPCVIAAMIVAQRNGELSFQSGHFILGMQSFTVSPLASRLVSFVFFGIGCLSIPRVFEAGSPCLVRVSSLCL